MRVLVMYKDMMQYLLNFLEKDTTLEEDEKILSDPTLHFHKRMVVIYRSERKKTIHSQMHLISWLIKILTNVDLASSKADFPNYFRDLTFEKTSKEEKLLSKEHYPQDQTSEEEHTLLEDFFIRRVNAARYLKEMYEFKMNLFEKEKEKEDETQTEAKTE